MTIVLTPEQESTMKAISGCTQIVNGERWYYNPYFLKSVGDGKYEQLRFPELPEKVKDIILGCHGINLPIL
jgi:hypothetical protein